MSHSNGSRSRGFFLQPRGIRTWIKPIRDLTYFYEVRSLISISPLHVFWQQFLTTWFVVRNCCHLNFAEAKLVVMFELSFRANCRYPFVPTPRPPPPLPDILSTCLRKSEIINQLRHSHSASLWHYWWHHLGHEIASGWNIINSTQLLKTLPQMD